jgi:RNA polymerase sigma-70 factor, ECF subfamily
MQINETIATLHTELRQLADWHMSGERADHTLQPTALVNEAYLRLVGQENLKFATRAHFLAAAAQTMRRILVEHARTKKSQKRGGNWKRIVIDDLNPSVRSSPIDQLDVMWLDEIIQKLATRHERISRIVVCRCFAGMTVDEVAQALDISVRTVADDWSYAKEWLLHEMSR